MIRFKIHKIARLENTTYSSAKEKVLNLASVMPGKTRHERVDAACEMIFEKIEEKRIIFQNVTFLELQI